MSYVANGQISGMALLLIVVNNLGIVFMFLSYVIYDLYIYDTTRFQFLNVKIEI